MTWTFYDWLFLIALLMLVLGEIAALIRKNNRGGEGQTISHKIIRWMNAKPERVLLRRVLIGLGLVWLLYHLVFQPYI